MNSLRSFASSAVALLKLCLREIFDESAYARFLTREGIPSSKHAYAHFIRERDRKRATNPRCC